MNIYKCSECGKEDFVYVAKDDKSCIALCMFCVKKRLVKNEMR